MASPLPRVVTILVPEQKVVYITSKHILLSRVHLYCHPNFKGDCRIGGTQGTQGEHSLSPQQSSSPIQCSDISGSIPKTGLSRQREFSDNGELSPQGRLFGYSMIRFTRKVLYYAEP